MVYLTFFPFVNKKYQISVTGQGPACQSSDSRASRKSRAAFKSTLIAFAGVPISQSMDPAEIKVLLVEDDDEMRIMLGDFISRMGVGIRTARDVPAALRTIQTESPPFNIVMTDLRLPGGTGMDVVKAAHARSPESLVTIVTGYASLETAIEAIRLGAYDYITKPFSLDEIGVQVRNMVERVALSRENARLSIRLQELYRELDQLQAERVEMLKFQEQILGLLRDATGKLDLLLDDGKAARQAERFSKTSLAAIPR